MTTRHPNSHWRHQLSKLVETAFHTLNTYGKSPEALGTIFLEFADALNGLTIEDINLAFKDWVKKHDAFPTPSDIRKLAENFRTLRLQRIGSYIPKVWVQQIRDEKTDEILAEFQHPKESLSNVEIDERWPSQRVRQVYARV